MYWRGILLSLIGIAATVWLAATGQLGLYIHPRYFVFTVTMAVIAAVVLVLAFALRPGAVHTHDAAEAEVEATDRHPRRQTWWAGASLVLVVTTGVALLVLQPTTLTSATVEQRDMNGSVVAGAGSSGAIDLDASGAIGDGTDAELTVKDWAGLLRQGADATALSGRTAELVGFVTPNADDPENVFYVARFVITCCAVDAQPVGVPVYQPGWRDLVQTDDWVRVTGPFVDNPSINSMEPTVVAPRELAATEQPGDPYVY